MISAIDTNVLLDILIPNTTFVSRSLECLGRAAQQGELIIGEMVFAELSVQFEEMGDLRRFLFETSIRLIPSEERSLYLAGRAWNTYTKTKPRQYVCPACGSSDPILCASCRRQLQLRRHIISDFLIGAHAETFADRLITRDRGFYRVYFQNFSIVDPTENH